MGSFFLTGEKKCPRPPLPRGLSAKLTGGENRKTAVLASAKAPRIRPCLPLWGRWQPVRADGGGIGGWMLCLTPSVKNQTQSPIHCGYTERIAQLSWPVNAMGRTERCICGKIPNIHRFIHSFHRLFHSHPLTLPQQNAAEFMILSHFRNLPAWIRGRKRIGPSIFIHRETGKGTLTRPFFHRASPRMDFVA